MPVLAIGATSHGRRFRCVATDVPVPVVRFDGSEYHGSRPETENRVEHHAHMKRIT